MTAIAPRDRKRGKVPAVLPAFLMTAFFAIGVGRGCSSKGTVASDTSAAVHLEAALPEEPPIQRLGDSDFRLTVLDGFDRPFRFSPDGKLLAGANWHEVRIWSFPDGKLMHDLSDQIQSRCIAFTEDGREFLALAQRDMSIYRFDVASGQLARRVALQDVVQEDGQTHYWLSVGGKWFCTTNLWGFTTVWEASTGTRLWREELFEPRGVRISGDGVLTMWDDIFLNRYDVRTGKLLGTSKHYRTLIDFAADPEGKLLAAYSPAEKAIVFIDPATNAPVGGKIPSGDREWRPEQAAISADGNRFVYWLPTSQWIFERKSTVFEVATGNVVSSFDPPPFDDPVISPDGTIVFSAGSRSVFCPIDVATGKPLRDVPDHFMAIEALSFTPDGRTLLVGGRDKRQAWDVASGKPSVVFESWYCTPYIAALNNEKAIVAGLRRGGARVQDIHTGQTERGIEENSDLHFSAFQVGSDRTTIAGILHLGGKRSVRRWNVTTGELVSNLDLPRPEGGRSHLDRNMCCGFALGGTRLVQFDGMLGNPPFNLVLSDSSTGKVTARWPLPGQANTAMAETRDGKFLAVVSSDYTRNHRGGCTYLSIFDVKTEKELLRIKQDRPDYFSAFSIASLAPDARLAATVRYKNQIDLWDGKTGELLQELETANPVTALAFSADGRMLASGHQDGRVYIWDTQAAMEHAEQR